MRSLFGGKAGGAKDRGNPFVNGTVSKRSHGGALGKRRLWLLRLRPFVPHRQHHKPRQRGTHEPHIDPLIPILGAGQSNHKVVACEILDRPVATPTSRTSPQSSPGLRAPVSQCGSSDVATNCHK
jgi:hypothetical protein